MIKLKTTITTLALIAVLISTQSALAIAPPAGPAPVNLLSAGNFALLSKAGVTNTGSHLSNIVGNIGASPITAASMNGVFCSEITGTIYGVDAAYIGSGNTICYAGNPPAGNKTLVDNAVLDMGTAYADAAGRTLPDGTELYAGDLSGQNFIPGLYKWSTDVSILSSDVTLTGGANDIWIFQIAGNLNVASAGSLAAGLKVKLLGGAQASNIFWQVGGATGATLGTYSTFNGNILSAKAISIQTGAVLNGRGFAQTQISLDANAVTKPIDTNGNLPGTVIGNGILNVTSVESTKTDANADGTFANGWKYTFNITVPTNEANLSMKFADWARTGGGGTIPAGGNMRISSVQADNANATIPVITTNIYTTPNLHITGDLDPLMDGLQVKVVVEVAVPVGTPSGAYTTTYGVKSE
ncbi:MAG: ice-binding family protein [bacterium]|nr:ice-binding family protein [bacterium]